MRRETIQEKREWRGGERKSTEATHVIPESGWLVHELLYTSSLLPHPKWSSLFLFSILFSLPLTHYPLLPPLNWDQCFSHPWHLRQVFSLFSTFLPHSRALYLLLYPFTQLTVSPWYMNHESVEKQNQRRKRGKEWRMGFIAPLLGLESKQSSEESESKTQKEAKNQENEWSRKMEKFSLQSKITVRDNFCIHYNKGTNWCWNGIITFWV